MLNVSNGTIASFETRSTASQMRQRQSQNHERSKREKDKQNKRLVGIVANAPNPQRSADLAAVERHYKPAGLIVRCFFR